MQGIDKFRERFKGLEEEYVLIGGGACDLLFDEAGRQFRATKDLDLVLLVEALTARFGRVFWQFVREGRRANGESIDGKNIKKHRNDVCRLASMLTGGERIAMGETVRMDMENFAASYESNPVDPKVLQIPGVGAQQIVDVLRSVYLRQS